jgi:amino acid transporter
VPGNKGLKADPLGYISNLVIAIASTAPAYSLAATLGFIVAIAGVGFHAPAVLIVSFIPILFVSVVYRFLNLADPDAGTTFAWTTRAIGPQVGWVNGWAIFLADIIVMASLAAIASNYTFLLFSSGGAPSNFWLIVAAVVWIAVMTWICYRGIELSARIHTFLLSLEIFTLALFVVVALVKVYANNPAHSVHVSASWFNPFDLGWGPLIDGVLLGIFIYWGWDSGVAVNEESRDRHRGPGKAAVVSTLILLLIYVAVSAAAQAFHGPTFLANNSNDVLNALGKGVFGSGLDKLLIICVLTSASASTQTTILPTARTTFSMARWQAIPSRFGQVHPRFQTPTFSSLRGSDPGRRRHHDGLRRGQGLQLLQHRREQLLEADLRDPDADLRRRRRAGPRCGPDVRVLAVLPRVLPSPVVPDRRSGGARSGRQASRRRDPGRAREGPPLRAGFLSGCASRSDARRVD